MQGKLRVASQALCEAQIGNNTSLRCCSTSTAVWAAHQMYSDVHGPGANRIQPPDRMEIACDDTTKKDIRVCEGMGRRRRARVPSNYVSHSSRFMCSAASMSNVDGNAEISRCWEFEQRRSALVRLRRQLFFGATSKYSEDRGVNLGSRCK